MKNWLFIIIALFISTGSKAQEGPVNDAELTKYPTYRSFVKKLKVDSVYKVTLENPGEIPSDIDKFKFIQRLSIFGNDWDYNLKSLPSAIYKLSDLTYLSIANTDISSLSSNINDLKNLSTLSIANNRITSLPKSIIECEDLSELVIDNNMREIPAIPSLEELTIYFQTNQGDDSGSIPNGITKLESCRVLKIYSEDTKINLTKMLGIILDMQVIENVSFIDPNLTGDEIKSLNVLRNIKELNLPSIQTDPDVFKGFANLKSLSFGKYLVDDPAIRKQFWETIIALPKLEEVSTVFNISDTGWYAKFKKVNLELNLDQTFPVQFEALKKLPTLNRLTFPVSSNIPLQFRDLKTVREIDLVDVNSQDFSYIFALLMVMPSLEKIIVSNDQFTVFPPETSRLVKLKEMEIYNIQHGAMEPIPEKEKARAQKLLPNCRFIYHE